MYKLKLKTFAIAVLSTGLASFSASTVAQQCQTPTPVWADEFDGSALDTSKWEIMLGDGCSYGICGWGNNELQSYQADNIAVANGVMSITARKERAQAKAYTSGRIRTANMPNGGQWTNGRFEARIKVPSATGTWSAFWMLPTDPDVGWPASGEIDIMESIGQADMFAFGTMHYGPPWPDNEFTGNRILKQPDVWSADFHTYAIEWEPSEIRWYLDDILYSVKTPADMSDSAFWTFENYQYHFLLNVAVGGNLGGAVDDSMLPDSMLIDFVRAYDFAQPSLTGKHIVDTGSTETYTVIDEAGTGSSYTWTSPTGETSISKSLTVNWGTTAGSVNVEVSNSCGTRNLVMDVHVLPEQVVETVLEDFESNRNFVYQTATGDFNQSASNPAPDTTNSSAIVGEYVRSAVEQWDVIVANTSDIPDVAPYIAGDKSFYIDVYTAAPVGTEILLQLENSSVATPTNYPNGRHSKYIAHTQVQNAWQKLQFKLEDRIDGPTADNQVNSYVLLLDPNAFTSDTYYLDNFDLHGAGGTGNPDTATSISVDNIVTGTQAAGQGKKYGTASVTIKDDLGNPAAGASVSGTFGESWSESVSGITDASGSVSFVTSTSSGGKVTVTFCVNSLNGNLPHDTAKSSGLCQ